MPTVSVPTASVVGTTFEPTDDADESNMENILIYCAMVAVIAIIVLNALADKKKK